MTPNHNSVTASKNPFLGLIPFTEDQGDLLYERDGDMELVISRLAAGPLTILFATSGVGKTSFIRAKLLRELRERFGDENVSAPPDWQRRRPIEGLKNIRQKIAMSGKLNETHVVVLDQFEEIFQYFASLERLDVCSEDSIERLDTFGEELAYLLNGSLADLPLQPVLAEGQVRTDTTLFAKPEKDLVANSDARDSDAEACFAQLKSQLDIRILISVREEFLADLSLFDSYLPGLFSNYYRLHKPNLEQARAIISQTIAPAKTSVHIEQLLNDIKAVNRRDPRHEDAVDPPYLQIVCKRLWDQQRPSEKAEFPVNYREGQAQKELDSYCREILDALPRKERVILCKVLGQLTGPKEAKKAVRVSDLTHEIRIHDRARLISLLEKLSAAGIFRKPLPRETAMNLLGQKRIFRTSLFSRVLQWFIPKRYDAKFERAAGDPVFELYHDMYAPLLWAWKTEQESKERLRANFIVVTAFVVLGLTVGNPLWEWSKRSQLLAKPPDALSQADDLREVRNAFAHSMIWMWLGNHLWRENCRRYSSYLALRGDTYGAIWYKTASFRIDNTPLGPRDFEQPLGPAGYLRNTTPSEPGVTFTDVILTSKDTDTKVKYIASTSNGKIIRYPDPTPIDIRQNAESIPSGATVKVLCLSPTGEWAVVAYVKDDILFVRLASTNSGKLQATEDYAKIEIFSATDNALKRAAKSGNTMGQQQQTWPHFDPDGSNLPLNAVRASFSADGTVFGILLNGKVMVRSVSTGRPLGISPADINVEDFSFSPHNHDLLALSINSEGNTQGLPDYGVSVPGLILNTLAFWKSSSKDGIQRSAGKLLPHARPVFGNGEAVLAINRDADTLHTDALNPILTQEHVWTWFSASEKAQGAYITLPGGVIPQAVDPNQNILLSTDSVGRLIFSAVTLAHAKSLVLTVSEQQGTIQESRNTTAVSVNDFSKKNLFASIDGNGSVLRIWSVPDLQALNQPPSITTTGFQVLDQPPLIATTDFPGFDHPLSSLRLPRPQDPIWFSLNNSWQAKCIHNHLEITPKAGDLSTKGSWSLSLSKCPGNVRISGDGDRVVIFDGAVLSYSSRGWANSRRKLVKLDKAPSTTKYVAFGPGQNRVALASDEELLIYGPEFGDGSSVSSAWSAKIKGPSSLVEGSKTEGNKKDDIIILTSTSWIHRISYSDSATSRFHRWLEGRKRSEPDISSMMTVAPIDTYYPKSLSLNLHTEVNTNKIIPKSEIQSPSPDAQPKSNYNMAERLRYSFVWTVDLCGVPSRHQAVSDLVCEWETRSGLHGSDLIRTNR